MTEQTAYCVAAVVTLVPFGFWLAYMFGRLFAKGKLRETELFCKKHKPEETDDDSR